MEACQVNIKFIKKYFRATGLQFYDHILFLIIKSLSSGPDVPGTQKKTVSTDEISN